MSALEGSKGVDVSLRELARMVGVSPAAVYRHFPNKDALLAELANAESRCEQRGSGIYEAPIKSGI